MLTLIAVAALSLGALGDPSAPRMRVPAADLRLSEPADAGLFAARVADRSRAFCAAHLTYVMPEHLAEPRLCEQAMARLAVAALPDAQRRAFQQAGGRRALTRLQR